MANSAFACAGSLLRTSSSYIWGKIIGNKAHLLVSTGIIWASSRKNLSLGFLTKRDSNQSPQLQRLARKLKIRLYQVLI